MGWWTQNKKGHSFAENEDGIEMVWGDGPADAMDNAIDQIVADFERVEGRRPTKDEMRAGLEFSLGGDEEVGRPQKGESDEAHG